MDLSLRNLPQYQEREYYTAPLVWEKLDKLTVLFDELIAQSVNDDAEAVTWINSWRELETILAQEHSIRRIEMTCNTADSTKMDAVSFFTQKVIPIYMEKAQALKEKVLQNAILKKRVQAEAPIFFKELATDAQIFRTENIPLHSKLEDLSQEYQKISGALVADWKGEKVTLQRLASEYESPDRSIREQAYHAEMGARLAARAEVDQLFDTMLELRQKLAKNAGFANYRDYIFQEKHRYDYDAKECLAFHEAIQKYWVPLSQKLFKKRKQDLGLNKLRSWDLNVDTVAKHQLSPFRDVDDLLAKGKRVFADVDPQLASFYDTMLEHSLFDLGNRKGKAPGGYQSFLQEARLPFIFMNAVGIHRDVITLLHESGHAFHSFLARDKDIFQVHAAIEFCEVASMSMELMSESHLPQVFGKEVAEQLMRQTLLAIPSLLLRIAMVDSFQHWIYTSSEGENSSARHQKWLELSRVYMPDIDLSGMEEEAAVGWHKILHIFQIPFYYVEYGIAELGALQFWQKYEADPSAALTDYKRALAAGGTMGPKDLFRRANLNWSLDAKTIAALAREFETKLERRGIV